MNLQKLLIPLTGAILVLYFGFYLISSFSRRQNDLPQERGRINVVTSFYPLYFMASLIGGERANVINITPAGAEPHDYEPTTRDVARIENSQMLILNGNVEAWGGKIKTNLLDTKVKIVIAGEGLFTQNINIDGNNQTDPHIWLSPQLAKREAQIILQAFVETDPVNKDYYKANAQQLFSDFDSLAKKFQEGLRQCRTKDIVTSHAAFGYLAASYGLHQVSIAGLSPDSEPSSRQLAEVAQFAKDNQIKYIFFETLVSPKLSETIASEIGAKTLVLDPLEGMSDDNIELGKNYFSVMEENLRNLQTALQCRN